MSVEDFNMHNILLEALIAWIVKEDESDVLKKSFGRVQAQAIHYNIGTCR